jgi:peptide subunit release factor 1 (eRF1)
LQSGELQRTSLMLAEHHDHEALKSELHELDEEIGNHWAVNGPRETLRALHRGQVRTLYILDTQEGGGFRCSATGRLVLAPGDCRGEGEAQPVPNLVDEAIEEALRQRVRVVMVPKGSGGEAVDGLAAMLRFR